MKENMKKTVVIRGPITTQSGYGTHARQVARWAFEQLQDRYPEDYQVYTQLTPWGITPWIIDRSAEDGLIERAYMACIPIPNDAQADISLQVQLPNEWNPFLAKVNVGITAAVEATVCNPEWIDAANRMDLVIVPSTFTRDVFLNTAKQTGKELTTKVVVVPESFPDSFLLPEKKANDNNELNRFLDEEVTTPFNFLMFGQITGTNLENDRKNIPYMIKWLHETFSDNPNVGIIIKTNRGRNTTIDKTATHTALIQLLSQLRGPDAIGPKFYLLHGHLTDEEVKTLHTHPKVKATVSTTRGEGFGIPLLEAAACGLPVMATDWSGHKDFLNKGKFIKFDYVLQDVHPSRIDNQIFLPGAKWAQCDEGDVKRKLKKFYENSSMPMEWAKELSVKVKEEFIFKAISRKYTEALRGIVSL